MMCIVGVLCALHYRLCLSRQFVSWLRRLNITFKSMNSLLNILEVTVMSEYSIPFSPSSPAS